MNSQLYWDREDVVEEYAGQLDERTDWYCGRRQLIDLLRPHSGKLLDYGCGPGVFARVFTDMGFSVIGVDSSPVAIQFARKQGLLCHLVENDELSMISAQSIDHAVASFVFCCIPERERIDRIVQQIHSLLKERGTLTILDPHPDSPSHEFLSYRREKLEQLYSGAPVRVSMNGLSEPFLDFWHPKEELMEILEHAGFYIEHIIEPVLQRYEGGINWKDETMQAPCIIYHTTKR